MAFRIEAGESVAKAIRRLVRHQIDRALARLDERGATTNDAEEVVHDVRKRLKKVRAVVRLARGALGRKLADREGRRFRDAARPLSEVRDAGVLIVSLDALAEHGGDWGLADAFDPARILLRRRLDEVERRAIDGADILTELATSLHQARRDVGRWDPADDDWDALAPGLGRIYREGVRAARTVAEAPTDENFHECRKRVKDLWYALDLLGPIRPVAIEDRSALADTLADLLGDDHDLAVLRAVLNDPANLAPGGDMTPLLPLIDERRVGLQGEARALADQLYAERPRDFDARFRAYWAAWRAEAEAARFDAP